MANKPVKKEDTLGATRNIASLATLYQSLVIILDYLTTCENADLQSQGMVHRPIESPPRTRRRPPIPYQGGEWHCGAYCKNPVLASRPGYLVGVSRFGTSIAANSCYGLVRL